MAKMAPPLTFVWDGEAMRPVSRFCQQKCDNHFVVGEKYMLAPYQGRATKSHRRYMATVNESWLNLPEQWARRFETAEQLRKFALIKTGWADHHSVVMPSTQAAITMAGFVRKRDDCAIVTTADNIVTIHTAKSQAQADMDGPTFEKSKKDVLEFLSALIGVDVDTLNRETGRAA